MVTTSIARRHIDISYYCKFINYIQVCMLLHVTIAVITLIEVMEWYYNNNIEWDGYIASCV